VSFEAWEELDFEVGRITSYGYEVYRGSERRYVYDDFLHPNDPTLVSTVPHHRHVPPDIKRNRIPVLKIRFTGPNPGVVIREIEKLLQT
jgi:hypothetical protein